MTKCSNCGEELKNNDDQAIDSKSFATKLKDGRIVCVACADIISLMEDLPTKEIKKNVVKEKKINKYLTNDESNFNSITGFFSYCFNTFLHRYMGASK